MIIGSDSSGEESCEEEEAAAAGGAPALVLPPPPAGGVLLPGPVPVPVPMPVPLLAPVPAGGGVAVGGVIIGGGGGQQQLQQQGPAAAARGLVLGAPIGAQWQVYSELRIGPYGDSWKMEAVRVPCGLPAAWFPGAVLPLDVNLELIIDTWRVGGVFRSRINNDCVIKKGLQEFKDYAGCSVTSFRLVGPASLEMIVSCMEEPAGAVKRAALQRQVEYGDLEEGVWPTVSSGLAFRFCLVERSAWFPFVRVTDTLCFAVAHRSYLRRSQETAIGSSALQKRRLSVPFAMVES